MQHVDADTGEKREDQIYVLHEESVDVEADIGENGKIKSMRCLKMPPPTNGFCRTKCDPRPN